MKADLGQYFLQMHELFTTQSRHLTTLKKKALENIVGKEENDGFPTVFSTLPQREIVSLAMFDLSSANALNLVMSKNLLFGRELNAIFYKQWLIYIH